MATRPVIFMLKVLVNYSPYNDEVSSYTWTHSPIRHRCREVNGNFDMLTMGEGFAIARAVKKVTSEYHIPLSDTQVKEIQGLLNKS